MITLINKFFLYFSIYGRFNLGKETSLVAGRYAHFATYINRTVSFGDRCRVIQDFFLSYLTEIIVDDFSPYVTDKIGLLEFGIYFG